MKKLFFILISCYKNDIEALNKQVVQFQHKLDSLSNTLTANTNILQKSADSLSQALALTNSKISQTSLSIAAAIKTSDSISTQLKAINTQISSLNSQLLNANANVTSISAQITTLNQQYADLLIKYNSLLSLITTYPFNTIRDGLVAYYPFTGNANDSSGNANNGIVTGATLTTDRFGLSNSAYNFNGLNSKISLPNAFFDGKNSITQCSFSTFININKSGSYGIWGKTIFWGEVNLLVNDDNSITFFWANSNTGNTYSSIRSEANKIAANKWYHIAVNFSNSVLKLYINGMEVNSTLSYSMQGGGFISNTNVNSQINFAQDLNSSIIGLTTISGNLTNYFNGKIDDLRVYNRTLTTNEIAYLNLN